ncbi:MAG: addiction module toxin, HicA family [Dehalococcoidia bacterium]|nr:addiction module toxin, HicA family [Dehalococcoidia bacterium]
MTREELVQLRQRAGNLSAGDLRDAAEQCGWTHVRTKGSHHAYRKAGDRTLIISEHMNSGTARGIINVLIRALE